MVDRVLKYLCNDNLIYSVFSFTEVMSKFWKYLSKFLLPKMVMSVFPGLFSYLCQNLI